MSGKLMKKDSHKAAMNEWLPYDKGQFNNLLTIS